METGIHVRMFRRRLLHKSSAVTLLESPWNGDSKLFTNSNFILFYTSSTQKKNQKKPQNLASIIAGLRMKTNYVNYYYYYYYYYLLQLGCYPVAVVVLHVYKIWNWLLLNLSREGYMRSMLWQLGIFGTISAFAFRHRETKKNLCRGGRSQDLPKTDF